MEPDYWLARWEEGRIGFHREQPQCWLVAHAARLLPRGDERLLVPLCGKSVDLAWLWRRGHAVVGVELSARAIRDFFAEQALPATTRPAPRGAPFEVTAHGSLELWRGDFFALDPARDGPFAALHDRAALIALPPPLRRRYAQRCGELLAPGGRMLIVTLEYAQARMAGPPFSVEPDEVRELFGPHGALDELGAKSLIDEEPHFRERGLDAVVERAWLLTRRSGSEK